MPPEVGGGMRIVPPPGRRARLGGALGGVRHARDGQAVGGATHSKASEWGAGIKAMRAGCLGYLRTEHISIYNRLMQNSYYYKIMLFYIYIKISEI